MTFMIILGGVAAIYIMLLIFRLAALALPVYTGLALGLWLLDRGTGYGMAIAGGLLGGVALLVTGRLLCAVLPPLYRGAVALAFTVPGGFAGYQAAVGLGGLALHSATALQLLGLLGACTGAVGAWQSLGSGAASPPAPGSAPEPAS